MEKHFVLSYPSYERCPDEECTKLEGLETILVDGPQTRVYDGCVYAFYGGSVPVGHLLTSVWFPVHGWYMLLSFSQVKQIELVVENQRETLETLFLNVALVPRNFFACVLDCERLQNVCVHSESSFLGVRLTRSLVWLDSFEYVSETGTMNLSELVCFTPRLRRLVVDAKVVLSADVLPLWTAELRELSLHCFGEHIFVCPNLCTLSWGDGCQLQILGEPCVTAAHCTVGKKRCSRGMFASLYEAVPAPFFIGEGPNFFRRAVSLQHTLRVFCFTTELPVGAVAVWDRSLSIFLREQALLETIVFRFSNAADVVVPFSGWWSNVCPRTASSVVLLKRLSQIEVPFPCEELCDYCFGRLLPYDLEPSELEVRNNGWYTKDCLYVRLE